MAQRNARHVAEGIAAVIDGSNVSVTSTDSVGVHIPTDSIDEALYQYRQLSGEIKANVHTVRDRDESRTAIWVTG